MENTSNEGPKKESLKADLLTFAYELGAWIVIPLVVLLLLGIYIDKKFDTKPIGMIVGLLLSLMSTSISIARKVKNFNP